MCAASLHCECWMLCMIGRGRPYNDRQGPTGGPQRPSGALAAANSVSERRPSPCQRIKAVRRSQSTSRAGNGRDGAGILDDAAVLDGCARCTETTGRALCASKSRASMAAVEWYQAAPQCAQGRNAGSRSAGGIGDRYVMTFHRLWNCSFSRAMLRPVWRASAMG